MKAVRTTTLIVRQGATVNEWLDTLATFGQWNLLDAEVESVERAILNVGPSWAIKVIHEEDV